MGWDDSRLQAPAGGVAPEQGAIWEGGVKTGTKGGQLRCSGRVRSSREGEFCGQSQDAEDVSLGAADRPAGAGGVSNVQKEGWSPAGESVKCQTESLGIR